MMELESKPKADMCGDIPVTTRVDAVIAALGKTGYTRLQRIEVVEESGVLVLRGQVPSFYLKQIAQNIVLAVPGIGEIRNELRVESDR